MIDKGVSLMLLVDGDLVEVEIEQIGSIRNPVVKELLVEREEEYE